MAVRHHTPAEGDHPTRGVGVCVYVSKLQAAEVAAVEFAATAVGVE